MTKKTKICGCGAVLEYYRHVRKWVCTQTGQLPENCNQVPVHEPEPPSDVEIAENLREVD